MTLLFSGVPVLAYLLILMLQVVPRVLTQSEVDLSYNSSSIGNNSLLSFSEIGEDPFNILRCWTPSVDCCRSSDSPSGVGLGNWFLPSGSAVVDLQDASSGDEFYVVRGNGSVDLYSRSDSSSMEGIYSCEVPKGGENRTLFVGIYQEGNGLPVVSRLAYVELSISVTCYSTGGPVTDVRWEVNGLSTTNNSLYSEVTMVTNRTEGAYRSVLTANRTSALLGMVECIVSNSRGESRGNITVENVLPHNPTIQSATPSATSLSLTWAGPTFELISHYDLTVTYQGPCTEETIEVKSVRVDDPPSTTREVTGLVPGSTYLVTIVAVSTRGRTSDVITGNFNTLTSAPSGTVQNLSVQVTMTTVTLSWEPLPCLSRNGNITFYSLTVMSIYDPIIRSIGVETGTQNYTIQNLIPGTQYELSLSANSANGAGPLAMMTNTTVIVPAPMLLLNGSSIPNNSIVDHTIIGEDRAALFCLTNLSGCCRGRDNPNNTGALGNWFYADGRDIPNLNDLLMGEGLFYDNRGMSTLRLNRLNRADNSLVAVEGIFRCEVPDSQFVNQNLFVGIYRNSTGGQLSSQLLYDTTRTSLICRSRGGPAAIVEWSKNGAFFEVTGFEVQKVVVDTLSSWYDTVLRLSSSEQDNVGDYSCYVRNSRSNTSANLAVRKPFVAVDEFIARVGTRSEVNCTTPNGATINEISWHNSTEDVIVMATNSAYVGLVFAPPSISDDGAVYLCRMTNGITTRTTIRLEASAPPTNLHVNSTSSTTATLMWEEPPDAIPGYLIYNLTCYAAISGVPSRSLVTAPGMTVGVIEGLEEGSVFACSVHSQLHGRLSVQSNAVMVTTATIAPSGSPTSFSKSDLTARSVTLSWQPVSLLDRNGVITEYDIYCNSSAPVGVVSSSYTQEGSFTIKGFTPATNYTCSVGASNEAGPGPRTYMQILFLSDETLFQIRFPVPNCAAWVSSQGDVKRMDIEIAILTQISQQQNPSLLTNGRFSICSDPTSVTYRASIEGTATTPSLVFASQIQNWINTNPIIAVNSAEIQLDSNCPVVIQSFDAPRCTNSNTISLVVIIAASCGGVVLLALCCIIIVVVCFWRKRRVKKKSFSNRQMTNKNNFGLASSRVTLQNHNVSDSSDDENYAHIPPQLPARPASVSDIRSNSISGKKLHARSTSQHSIRYIRGPREPGSSADTTDGNYAEINMANSSRLRERRPSDYEPVLVRNIGLMSTEALNSISPTDLPKDEFDAAGKKLGEFEMPSLHPTLVGNDYETMRSVGFRNRSGTVETCMSEDTSEVIRNSRALTVSGTAPNPMYSTSNSTLDVAVNSPKRISESNLDNWESPQRGSDGYSIPNKVKRPSLPTDSTPLIAEGHQNGVPEPPHMDQPNVLYNIPTIPAQKSDRAPLITFSPMTSTENLVDENRNQDERPAPVKYRHANHVLYNIPTMPVQSNSSVPSNISQTPPTSNGTTASVPPQLYDVPPNRGGNQTLENVNSNSSSNGNTQTGVRNVTYEKPGSGSMGSLLYDVPTSSEKLESNNIIPGTESSELKT